MGGGGGTDKLTSFSLIAIAQAMLVLDMYLCYEIFVN